MADVVSTQIIQNGARNLIILFTNLSDGTGEIAVKKVDAASATYANNGIAPGIHLAVWRIEYQVHAMDLQIQWDATSPQNMVLLSSDQNPSFRTFGGLTVPVIAGATGSILFTTLGAMPNSSYSVTLEMKKNV